MKYTIEQIIKEIDKTQEAILALNTTYQNTPDNERDSIDNAIRRLLCHKTLLKSLHICEEVTIRDL